jgi:hypothetical protein
MKYTNISGKELTSFDLDMLKTKHAKPKAAKPESRAFHKGYRVVGHPKGACERARLDSLEEWRIWQSFGSKGKSPKLWNEISWRLNTKKRAIRSKPYGIYSAAQICKELALKDGWEDVDIIEISKGQAPEVPIK